MHDAARVANELIERGKGRTRPFTPLQIQKLLYFAHGWMLGWHDRPLIDEEFETWQYGPVVPSVYHCLSHNRNQPVTEPIPLHENDQSEFDEVEQDLIEQVINVYGKQSGMALSRRTHAPGTPWDKARKKSSWVVPDSLIRAHFRRKARKLKLR